MEFVQDLHQSASSDERIEFYKKTYLHVAFAILAFIGVEALLLQYAEPLVNAMLGIGQLSWLLVLGGFYLATTFAEKLSLKLDKNQQYMGLGIYVLAEAVLFLPMIYIATNVVGSDILYQASFITLAMFSGMTYLALFGNTDFSFLRSALTIGTFVAIGLIIVGAIFGFNLGLWFSVGMVVLASGSILYQTSQLKHQYGTDQYVGAAVGLFAAIMLLFWYILRILMRSRD